jgi:hypothetical protein
MNNQFSIGTDPEFFVAENGVISSAAGKLGCTKDDKLVLSEDVRLQEDNVLAEFDINPQVGFEAFDDNVKRGLDLVNKKLAEKNLELAFGVSSHIFSEEELKSFHESAFVFGCTPDFNAFTGQKTPSPSAANPGLRTAGGHVHIGFNGVVTVDRQSQQIAGVLCDYYLSLISVILDKDTRRKELYGKASCIRMKDYGIEYRSLSNFWVADKSSRKTIYDQVEKVVKNLNMDHLMELNNKLPIENLHNIINTNDVRSADDFLSRLQVA